MQRVLAEPHRWIEWGHLPYFLAVAREGSLSAAARSLGVNQSTVFRRIGALEERLGARLFERQARGYALTGLGERVLPLAMRMEDDALAVERIVVGADDALQGVIRFTTVLELLACVAPHLRAFMDRYPGIGLDIDTDPRVASLGRREADVALRPGGPPSELDVVGRKLVRAPLAAYASADYLERRGRPSAMEDLAGHNLIAFTAPGRAPLQHPRSRTMMRIGSMSGQALAARSGAGVAALPVFVGDADPTLERLFIVPAPATHHVWLLTHADLRQTARVRTFIDFLSEAIRRDAVHYEGEPSSHSRR